MKTKGASTRADRFPPATCQIDPKINALLETSRVHCSCVSNEDFDNSCLISNWTPSSEEMRACRHKKADSLVQVILATRGTPRSSVLPKKTSSAPPTGQAATVPAAQKISSRQTVARRKQKPSEFQHFMTAAEHIGWYRESYTSCPTLGQFPHFSRTFHPSLSIAQANNTISIDNEIDNCYTEPASSTEETLEQPIYVLRKSPANQYMYNPPPMTIASTPEDRSSDHLSGISNTERNFYPSPVTFQEPSNGFISSFFPKLHRSSYYRAHAQRKLLHRGNRLLELYPRTYGKSDIEKICGLQYVQPKQLSVPSINHDIDYNEYVDDDDGDDNGEEDDSQASQPQDSVSSVDCTDQSVNGTYSSFTWEVDNSSNVVLPFSVDDPKQQNPSLRMAMKKLSTIQRRRYTFPTCSMDKRQDSPKQFEITGIHYTTLVTPMGTIPRLPKNLSTLTKRRSKQDKRSPILHQMISMSGNRSACDRASKSPYTETSKHIFPFKNESETCYKTNCVSKDRSDSQQRDVSLHNNCISKSRRRVLHKYLATRLQNSGSYDRLSRQNHKPENSVKLGIIMPNAKESLQAAQENSQ